MPRFRWRVALHGFDRGRRDDGGLALEVDNLHRVAARVLERSGEAGRRTVALNGCLTTDTAGILQIDMAGGGCSDTPHGQACRCTGTRSPMDLRTMLGYDT